MYGSRIEGDLVYLIHNMYILNCIFTKDVVAIQAQKVIGDQYINLSLGWSALKSQTNTTEFSQVYDEILAELRKQAGGGLIITPTPQALDDIIFYLPKLPRPR